MSRRQDALSCRAGAANAQSVGFDGVEIHAANGNLLDQFLRDKTNQRRDAYGGSIPNRAPLLIEIAEAVIGVWGPERVGVQVSPLNPFNDIADSTPEETFGYVIDQLDRLRLAFLDVVEDGTSLHARHFRRSWNPGTDCKSRIRSGTRPRAVGGWRCRCCGVRRSVPRQPGLTGTFSTRGRFESAQSQELLWRRRGRLHGLSILELGSCDSDISNDRPTRSTGFAADQVRRTGAETIATPFSVRKFRLAARIRIAQPYGSMSGTSRAC